MVTPIAALIAHAAFAQVLATFVPLSVASNFLGSLVVSWTIAPRRAGADTSSGRAVAGALAMSVVASAMGSCGLVSAHMVASEAALSAGINWALGDLIGIACIAPTCLLLSRRVAAVDVDGAQPADYAGALERLVDLPDAALCETKQ